MTEKWEHRAARLEETVQWLTWAIASILVVVVILGLYVLTL